MTKAQLQLGFARKVLEVRRRQWQRLDGLSPTHDVSIVDVENAWLAYQEADLNVELALLDVPSAERS